MEPLPYMAINQYQSSMACCPTQVSRVRKVRTWHRIIRCHMIWHHMDPFIYPYITRHHVVSSYRGLSKPSKFSNIVIRFTQTNLPSTDFHTKFVILSLDGLSLHWSRASWPVASFSITKSLIWINAYKCRKLEFPHLYVCQWNWIRGSCIQNGILGAHRCPCLSEAFSFLLTAITCLPLSPTQKSTAVIMQLLGENLLL